MKSITIKDFFISTEATFKGCKIPKRKPDYVSRSSYDRSPTGSAYWYGSDKKGTYVIRRSDHWVKKKEFNKKRLIIDIPNISSCIWHIKAKNASDAKLLCGKAYLADFTRISAAR